jgi:enoyl-CoA hydratase/carnithine racemase
VAAVSLAVLLRSSEQRSIEDGLAAESAVYSTLQAGAEFAAWRQSRGAGTLAPDLEPPVLVERTGDELHITLNRPRRHNAVTAALRDGLAEALTLAAADDSIVAVHLSGNGPSFCSGGDLAEFGSFPDPATAHVTRLTRSPARLAHQIADRLHVHLHGACMGAGIEVPALAGHVVARSDAVIGLPELGLGLVPGAGGTASIPKRIGRHRTAALALSGARIDATTALAWGLVDEIAG